jgi:hypothetical protein
MTTSPITLQDLRRRIYVKVKAEPTWRFWGLYVHICKRQALEEEAYQMVKSKQQWVPRIDGVAFEAIEESALLGRPCVLGDVFLFACLGLGVASVIRTDRDLGDDWKASMIFCCFAARYTLALLRAAH